MRSTDERFLELLRTHLGGYRADEARSDVPIYSAACGIERRLAGGKIARGVDSLYLDSTRIYRGRIREEMAARLISSMRDGATARSNEFVRIRAAGVAHDGAAILLPGPPEPKLPTMAALLARAGFPYLGDEVLNIDPILRRVHGVDLPLLLDAQDLPLFPELQRAPARRAKALPEEARALVPRRPVSLDELGGRSSDPVPIGWIVFPYFEPGAPTVLEPFGGSQALYRFIEAGLNLHVWEQRAFTLMQQILESTPVSRLVVGSPPDAARLLVESAPALVAG